MRVLSRSRAAGRATYWLFTIAFASAVIPEALAGQTTTLTACYVPKSGTVYRIKAPNTPQACTKADHVEFNWSDQSDAGQRKAQGPSGGGAPLGIRAYAYVSGNGALDAKRSRGIVSVTNPATGKYCITAEPGITPDTHPLLVSQADDALAALTWDEDLIGIGTCAPGQYGISAFSTTNGTSTSLGFTILIP